MFFLTNWLALKRKLQKRVLFDSKLLIENTKKAYLLKLILLYFNLVSVLKNTPNNFEGFWDELFSTIIESSPTGNFNIF